MIPEATRGLVFEGRPSHERMLGYLEDGPWPPPERLLFVKAPLTGLYEVVDPDAPDFDQTLVDNLVRGGFEATTYTRRSFSTIEPGSSQFIFPCARYAPEGMDDSGRPLRVEQDA